MTAYFALFVSAFAAATLLPFYSEVVLVGLLSQGYSAFWVWAVASLGNTLGAVMNWLMGKYLLHFQYRKWFPFKAEGIERSQRWYNRYGIWSLLMAWLPVGGDALTFIAGVMRANFWVFFILVAIGKSARYAVLIALYFGVV